MDIIKKDFKKGTVKLKINNLEDIWYLSHLIDAGDFVKGKATRKIKIGDGENAKITKKTYFLKIESETINIGPQGDLLKVNGKIKGGPEDIPKDSYQSINLGLNDEFTLEKVRWLEYQKKKLQEAAEKKYNYLICIMDREEALFALTKDFGYDILVKIKGDVPKKAQKVEVRKDFHQELIKTLETYSARHNPECIILASPAFYKEDLFKKIKTPELKKKIVLAICSDVSESSLDEIIKRPELKNTLKSSRSRIEKILVDELLAEINKNGLAAYGIKDVQRVVLAGAVTKLIITDEFIQQRKEKNTFTEIDELMKHVDNLKGEIHILSSKNESGKKLDGLGGVATLLRYKL